MFKKILCPTDLSETCAIAIAKSAQLARMCGAELVLLNVRAEFLDHHEMVMLRTPRKKLLEAERDTAVAAKNVMEDELARANGADLKHKILLREGEPHKQILETAVEENCDLILLATTGRDRLIEHVKGSGAEKLVAKTRIPILLFPVATHPGAPA